MKKQFKILKNIFYIKKVPILSSILLISIFVLVGCETFELSSEWRDREIIIDGRNNDWLGAMMYIEDENISVGLLNDESFMYFCMIAENPLIRTQVMRRSFTLWFDPEGGKKKTFGIRFPIGMQMRDAPMRRSDDEQNREEVRDISKRALTELEILGPGEEEQKRMPVAEAKGIDIRIEASSGMLVYELKVPLQSSEEYPYAIGAKPGASIGLGLETPKIDRSAMRERMGDRMPGGIGRGGGRGGMEGRTGGIGMRGEGRSPQMPKEIKLWAIVQLAPIK